MKIVIAGCGWLGKGVARHLMHAGHELCGSYRSETTKNELHKRGIQPFHFDLALSQADYSCLEHADFVFIFFPPSSFQQGQESFEHFHRLLDAIPQGAKMIYSSSIGIYPKESGLYTEAFNTKESTKPLLVKLEGMIQSRVQESMVLRLGGLIGPDRHPVVSIAGKQLETDGESAPNFVDARDISRFLENAIIHFNPGIYNFVAPCQQSKKVHYTKLSAALNLEAPSFGTKQEEKRIISMERFKNAYDFEFRFTPENWLFNRLE